MKMIVDVPTVAQVRERADSMEVWSDDNADYVHLGITHSFIPRQTQYIVFHLDKRFSDTFEYIGEGIRMKHIEDYGYENEVEIHVEDVPLLIQRHNNLFDSDIH